MPGPNDVAPVDISPTPASLVDRLRGLLGGAAFGQITTDYGAPAAYTHAFHSGLDFAAAPGAAVKLPVPGTLERVFYDQQGGNQVEVRTSQGYSQIFAHLSGYGPDLRAGKQLLAGETVGYVGATGMASGPHLHYEIVKPGGKLGTRDGTIDPRVFIGEFAPDTRGIVIGQRPTPGQLPGETPGTSIIRPGESGRSTGETITGPNIPNPLDALGRIADSLAKITDPRTWVKPAFTLAGAALIIMGMALYVGGMKEPQVTVQP